MTFIENGCAYLKKFFLLLFIKFALEKKKIKKLGYICVKKGS